jgi:hypothetical protein
VLNQWRQRREMERYKTYEIADCICQGAIGIDNLLFSIPFDQRKK